MARTKNTERKQSAQNTNIGSLCFVLYKCLLVEVITGAFIQRKV